MTSKLFPSAQQRRSGHHIGGSTVDNYGLKETVYETVEVRPPSRLDRLGRVCFWFFTGAAAVLALGGAILISASSGEGRELLKLTYVFLVIPLCLGMWCLGGILSYILRDPKETR